MIAAKKWDLFISKPCQISSRELRNYFPAPIIALITTALTPLCFNWMRASVEVSN
jgi:hypothetical protein